MTFWKPDFECEIEAVTVYTAPILKMLAQAISPVIETNNVSPFKLYLHKFLLISRILANVISSDVYIYILKLIIHTCLYKWECIKTGIHIVIYNCR